MDINNLNFTDNNLTIRGKLFIPQNNISPDTIVILSHGFSTNHPVTDSFAKLIANHGITCYTFDFCGAPHSTSDGDFNDMSVKTEQHNLETVVSGLKNKYHQIILSGISQGGMVTAMTAAAHPQLFKGLILLYPAFVIPDDSHRAYPSLDNLPTHPNIFGRIVSRRYVLDDYDLDINKIQAAYARPVLIIHGTADHVVPYTYSLLAVKTYPNAKLCTIKGADHGFSADIKQADKAIITFLNKLINN